jgi:uncharacterized protein GlcG (DUF336 family)
MKQSLAALLCVAAPLLVAQPAGAQAVITERNLSTAAALTIAEHAHACTLGRGYKVSITVVDRAGQELVFLRDNEANPHTPDNSHRKAFAARTFRMTSAQFGEMVAKNPGRAAQALLPNVTTAAGGVPIAVGDDVIGAIGVSGSPGGENDELCARQGIAAVADQLK